MRLILIFSFFIFSIAVKGQDEISPLISPAQLGFSGLIYTPSAYMKPWKTVDIGFTHFSKATSFTYLAGIKSERAFIANMVFLPRIAFSVKLTRPYSNLRPDYQLGSGQARNWGIGDRSFSIRAQVLKEKKWQPALVIGIQDPSANLAYFNTNYAVVSKSLTVKNFLFSANLGYGFSENSNRNRGDYLRGVFGGLTTTWQQLTGMIEYDTQQLNIGINYALNNRFFFNIGLVDVKHFSGNLSFRFSLK